LVYSLRLYDISFVFYIGSEFIFNAKFAVKGCDSNFEVNLSQNLKVATNETTTLH